MGKRIATWCAVAAMGLFGALMISTPAQATTDNEVVCPQSAWEARDFDNGWVPAAESGAVDSTTVHLTKLDGAIGTSFETTNLGLDVEAGDTITVKVDLIEGATATAGAIRMFFYDHPNADTITEAPTATVIAEGSGTLTLTIGADATIGTFGLTYDASNDSTGTVKFENLTIGYTTISFTECVEPDPTPTATPSPSPEPEPAEEPTEEPVTEPTDDPADKPGLPVTGSRLVWLAGGGLGLLATGAGALGLSKLRRFRLQ